MRPELSEAIDRLHFEIELDATGREYLRCPLSACQLAVRIPIGPGKPLGYSREGVRIAKVNLVLHMAATHRRSRLPATMDKVYLEAHRLFGDRSLGIPPLLDHEPYLTA